MKKIIAILILLWSMAACSAVVLYPEKSVAKNYDYTLDTIKPYDDLSLFKYVPKQKRTTKREVIRRPRTDIIYEYD